MQSTKAMPAWPELPLEQWADTQATIHRWTQIVGKTRLALAPMQNHWWQVVLYVTSRGLTTSPIPCEDRTFDVSFDFTDHQLIAESSDGGKSTMALDARPVADFYTEYMEVLKTLGVEVTIYPVPMELADTLSLRDDRVHAAYDAGAANRLAPAIGPADRGVNEFPGRLLGET